jgi:hypothetical protein
MAIITITTKFCFTRTLLTQCDPSISLQLQKLFGSIEMKAKPRPIIKNSSCFKLNLQKFYIGLNLNQKFPKNQKFFYF